MAEAATIETLTSADIAQRALTEVEQIRRHLRPDGSLAPEDRLDLEADYYTATQEMAMPFAVSTTLHRAEYHHDEHGRSRRIFKWLGKSAVEVAMSGYEFYVSEAGNRRADVEVAEARHGQEHAEPGLAQAFISPEMSAYDAPLETAKAENLHGQDSIRVSYSVTDKCGVVVARRLESLLVSDVPLEAWMKMLKDPGNLFGKAFAVRDERSALSVMELFSDLNLPEDLLPRGPVTIVEAVLPYIADARKQASVASQIDQFRASQELYRQQAEKTARQWLEFDLELARSLEGGTASLPVESFIAVLQHQWGEQDLRIIQAHDVAGRYIMTTQLATVLEKAKRNLLISQAALATGNRQVLAQTDGPTARRLLDGIEQLEMLRQRNAGAAEIAYREAMLMRSLAGQNFRVGGGCAGGTTGTFDNNNSSDPFRADNEENPDQSEDVAGWSWKKGICRVESCGSPRPTEVGPCSVCRNCQHQFDRGLDPTSPSPRAEGNRPAGRDIWKYFLKAAGADTSVPDHAKTSEFAIAA